MKIEKLDKENKKVDFKNLKRGDCYLDYQGNLCIKIDTLYSDSGNAYDCICLEDGSLGSDYGEVTLVEATIQYYIK